MPIFNAHGTEFNYIDVGEGIPFIFQHGLGGDLTQPYSLIAPVEGFRFLSFDFRGHGESSTSTADAYCFDSFSDDLISFMDEMKLENAVVGGISMGGGVALNSTIRYPARVKGCVIIRPAWLDSPMDADIQKMFACVAHLIEAYSKEEGCERLKKLDWMKNLEEEYPAVANSFLSMFEYKKAKETFSKYIKLPSDRSSLNRNSWSNISVPVLIVANDKDPVHPLDFGRIYSEYIPTSEFHKVTSKSEDENQHYEETRAALIKYLSKNLIKTE